MTRILGPGSLSIGPAATPKQWGGDVTKITIEPSAKSDDPIPLLDGTDELGADTITWAMKGSVLQSYADLDEFVFWAAANAGQELDFTFVPAISSNVRATGKLKVRPVTIGGDVKKKNSADFEFPIVGDPDFTAGP